MSQADCCAEFYEKDWVQKLLGPSLHPGGLEMSRRLWESLPLGPGVQVLDVASGTGATAVTLARETGSTVTGLDFSAANVVRANRRAADVGERGRVTFLEGDAARLPFADDSFDIVVCECAVSTFAHKAAVAAEFKRVLRPGGSGGISDMARNQPLPDDLARVLGPWTCVGDALSVEDNQRLFLDAGLRVTRTDDASDALRDMLTDLKRKLVVAGLGGVVAGLHDVGLDIEQARALIRRAHELVDEQEVQYFRMGFANGVPASRDVEGAPVGGPRRGG